jgi:hypothetical protein
MIVLGDEARDNDLVSKAGIYGVGLFANDALNLIEATNPKNAAPGHSQGPSSWPVGIQRHYLSGGKDCCWRRGEHGAAELLEAIAFLREASAKGPHCGSTGKSCLDYCPAANVTHH